MRKRILCSATMLFMAFVSLLDIKAYSIDTSIFKPLNSDEQKVGDTDIGYWNNGGFFETVTYQIIGYDAEAGKQIIRFRHYITHKGEPGSYTYQAIPVGIYVDGNEVARFTSQIGSHIYNETRFCGEQTVTLFSGSHLVELKDIGSGATTVVNMSKRINVDPPKFTVTFKDWNNVTLKTQMVFQGYNASAPANPSRTGYSFIGWDKEFNNVQKDLTVTALYKINNYTVKFIDYNGTVLKTQSVPYQSNASPPANPTRVGYTFTGWSGIFTNVTSDRTITALYKLNSYNAFTTHWLEKDDTREAWNPAGTLNSAGNMIVSSTANFQTVQYGNNYKPEPISITGYELSSNTFGYNAVKGWTYGNLGSAIKVYQNTSVEVYYRKKEYAISFESNGGSIIQNQTIKYNNKVTSLTPTKTNHKFIGWYTDSSLSKKFNFDTQVTENIKLYAKWDEIPKIVADNLTIFRNSYTSEEWKKVRMEDVKAADKEDGDLTENISVVYDNVDHTTIGTYKITYQVKDSAGSISSKSINVFVIENAQPPANNEKRIRSISNKYRDTLAMDSMWRTDAEKNRLLWATLDRVDSNTKSIWKLTPDAIEQIKEFNKEHDLSPESNQLFFEQFSDLKE